MPQDSVVRAPSPKPGVFRRVWRSLLKHVIQDVPAENAACEFDCRETDCSPQKWEACGDRLRTAADDSAGATRSGKPKSVSK
jgi:hypothetical protein